MTTRIRKYSSGAGERKKKQKTKVEAKSQTGVLDRYFVRDSQIDSENRTADVNVDDVRDDNAVEVEHEVCLLLYYPIPFLGFVFDICINIVQNKRDFKLYKNVRVCSTHNNSSVI